MILRVDDVSFNDVLFEIRRRLLAQECRDDGFLLGIMKVAYPENAQTYRIFGMAATAEPPSLRGDKGLTGDCSRAWAEYDKTMPRGTNASVRKVIILNEFAAKIILQRIVRNQGIGPCSYRVAVAAADWNVGGSETSVLVVVSPCLCVFIVIKHGGLVTGWRLLGLCQRGRPGWRSCPVNLTLEVDQRVREDQWQGGSARKQLCF